MKWNDDWREELKNNDYPCYIRLCECRNTIKDIKLMAKLMYKYNSDKEKEMCLDRIIEWVCDWNSQFDEIEINEDMYNTMLAEM